MPKRSTEFQKLIYLIHHQLEKGAIVTESKMLRDRITGQEREVDIVIEVGTGNYTITIGVECVEPSRPATVEWIDKMSGKHQSLPTDKLVLVSKSGFTKDALAKAKLLGIEIISFEEAISTDWTVFVNKVEELFIAIFNSKVVSCQAFVVNDDDKIDAHTIDSEQILYADNRELYTTARQLVDVVLHDAQVQKAILTKVSSDGKQSTTLEFRMPLSIYADDITGTRREVKGLRLRLESTRTTQPIELQYGAVGKAQVAFGKATFAQVNSSGENIFLALLEQQGQPGTAAISLDSGKNEKQVIDLIEGKTVDIDTGNLWFKIY